MATFTLSLEEAKKAVAFKIAHEEKHGRVKAAIGGRFTFELTPTSCGTAVVINCACGESQDLTDYGEW